MTVRSNAKLNLDDIKPYLEGVKNKGGQLVADCPLCGKKGHLYVSEKNGEVLVYCQKCNAPGTDFFKAWRVMGAKHEELEPMDYKQVKPIEDYYHIYRNPDGTEAYRKRRRKWADGHKVFSFLYEENGRTQYKKPDNCNNLYNLDSLAEADPETTLYIVEGEKCVDAMTKVGLLATTTNTGAQKNIKLTEVDKSLLDKFKDKVLIPDNDDKGTDYSNAWEGVRVLALPKVWKDCPKKGDVADYFKQGGDVDAIINYEWPVKYELTEEFIKSLTKNQMFNSALMEAINAITEPDERMRIISLVDCQATANKCATNFKKYFQTYMVQQAAKHIRSENMTSFPLQPFQLRCGEWSTGVEGVYHMKQQGGGYNTIFVKDYASPIPIMPTEILCNAEDGTEKIRLAYQKEGRWNHLLVARNTVANKQKIINLADNGIEVNSNNAGALVKYLADVVALNPDILPRVKSIDHLGWIDGTFIPYNDDFKLDCEEQYKSLISAIMDKGTLDEWVEFVRPLRENLYMRLILAASFASVLIEKVNALPFVLHLWGGTGSGKTVAMMVAASVWGNPAMGRMVRTMNMTQNSMMSMAAVLRNLPFFGDELQTIKSRYENYDTLIMCITEGVDRGRMNSDSRLQKQRNWLNSFIFTGEEPCTRAESGGGVVNRVIEIECDQQIINNGNAVVNFVGGNFGCAGKAFIEALADENLKEDYNAIMQMLLDFTQTTEKQAMAMALMMQADAIASKAIFNEPGNVLTSEIVAPFLKSKAQVDVAERAYHVVMAIIAENAENFDSGVLQADERFMKTYWGRIRHDGIVFINKNVLSKMLTNNGFDFEAVKKKWCERGYLIRNSQGRFYGAYTLNKVTAYYVRLRFGKHQANVI